MLVSFVSLAKFWLSVQCPSSGLFFMSLSNAIYFANWFCGLVTGWRCGRTRGMVVTYVLIIPWFGNHTLWFLRPVISAFCQGRPILRIGLILDHSIFFEVFFGSIIQARWVLVWFQMLHRATKLASSTSHDGDTFHIVPAVLTLLWFEYLIDSSNYR